MPSSKQTSTESKTFNVGPQDEAPIINKRSPEFQSYYTNNAAFGMSAFDFSIIFGEILGLQGDKMVVEQKTKIIMSPLHAKIFLHVMAANLQKFEESFGEIKLPADVPTAHVPVMGADR